MKKIFFILIICIFALINTRSVFAQELRVPVPAVEITPTKTPTPTIIEYNLPYHGILPTSPLYTLKLIKDGISDLLISDPLRKTSFYLLQADKRLSAVIVLYEEGDEDLGEETLLNGIEYLEKSMTKLNEANEEQYNVEDVFGKIQTSVKKHKEVINGISENKNAKMTEKLQESKKRIEEIENRAESFRP